MARQKIRFNISEIEALGRWLDEIASTGGGLPENILQRFERLLAVAQDPSLQDEAARLTTELYQFADERQRIERRRTVSDPAQVNVRLEPPLLAALDRFAEEQHGKPNRPEALRMILTDALTRYGILQAPESRELNGG